MTDEYTQHLKISSTDGRRKVERFIKNVIDKADKGQTEFGLNITVERVDVEQEE